MDKIFAIVGAPTEATMPGCSAYPNYGMVEGVNRWPARSRLRQASVTPSRGPGVGGHTIMASRAGVPLLVPRSASWHGPGHARTAAMHALHEGRQPAQPGSAG